MALTTATQNQLYQFFAIAFDAAPGVTYMSQLTDAVNAGMTVPDIVEVFTTKTQFTSVYPNFYTSNQFATKLIDNVVGNSAAATAKAAAVADVEAALTAGWSRGQVVYQIFSNLAAKPETDATWGNTAKMMANQVAVAKYVTETQLVDTVDLTTLKGFLANVTAASDVSTPAAIQAITRAAIPGQTFTLTTGADNVGGSTNSYTGTVADAGVTAAGGSTFQTGDKISSAKEVAVTFAATPTTAIAADIDSTTSFKGTMLADATINAVLFDGVSNILNAGGGLDKTLTIQNGALATTYGITGDTSAAKITVEIRAANTAGTADTINFSVNGAGSVTPVSGQNPIIKSAALTSSSTGIEKIAVSTTGTNVFSVTDATAPGATDYVTLEVTGNGSNTITASDLGQLTTIDMSASTGTNAVNMGAALQTGTTIKGGSGADTLRVTQNTTVANLTATGVETLRLNKDATGGNLVFASAPSFTTIRLDGDTSESTVHTLTSIGGSVATINLVGDALTANAGTALQFGSLVVNSSYTGAADSVTMNIGNGGIARTADYTVGNATGGITLNGVETLKIAVSDEASTSTTTFANGLSSTALSSLTVTANGIVALGTVSAAPTTGSGSLNLIDFSGVNGGSASAQSSLTLADNSVGAATVVKAGKGGLSLTLNAEATGDQVIFTGAEGVDTVDGKTNSFAGVIVADGKAGADVLKGGTGADALTGGEGADTITGFKGNDTIILTETGAAQDTVVFENTAANNGVDTITGFGSTDVLNFLAFITPKDVTGGAGDTSTLGLTIASSLDFSSNAANIITLKDIQSLTASNFGTTASATVIKVKASSSYVVMADKVADADGSANIYYVTTDGSSVATVTLVGTVNATDVSSLTTSNFA